MNLNERLASGMGAHEALITYAQQYAEYLSNKEQPTLEARIAARENIRQMTRITRDLGLDMLTDMWDGVRAMLRPVAVSDETP